MGHNESTHLKPAFMENAFYSEKNKFKKKKKLTKSLRSGRERIGQWQWHFLTVLFGTHIQVSSFSAYFPKSHDYTSMKYVI